MQHAIPVERYGAAGANMARAVEACVHCGFCLPACPTYRVLGEEMDSPRGRIFLMKEALEGRLRVEEVLPYVDRCLACLGCETACPSGVRYAELVLPFRELAERKHRRPLPERLLRGLVMTILPFPGRFRMAARAGVLVRPLRRILPARPRAMLDLLPPRLPRANALPAVIPAQGKPRARVALLVGCVQQVLAPQINRAVVRVLSRNGVEVVVPRGQGCCGALALHSGFGELARRLARHNLRIFPENVDAVVANAAGCGSAMQEYGLLFRGRPEAERAAAFATSTRDVSAFLCELGFTSPPPLPRPVRVVYHDACHLLHAQRVREAPRRLLESVGNLELLEPADAEICCGSAGIYNLEHPGIAAELGRRKAQTLLSTGAEVVATGNIGCMVQLRAHLRALQRPLPVLHTFELLDRAYTGEPLGDGAV
ncbi:MAG: heterodisulfide reductase-related iron-sulfur binding cluster [Armatimonadota bacterium]|nr:heterodisulfide reductase-related iron-sulfur binding cluster [Armatimonadota bacterium]MDR7439125.1 heterodisulfide reductase-related iron-sulfur binding cluster [Armatimonadota bacterium]MDR7562154.1 heterodisulfide reductase-related iron-sulfur binding cluster [Armatimonadota bacterium]MDR7567101.1 heterodisulfide reductase-related iron-sulfur binding cluster [Armatimonadota bacterium]MDR7602348.1 heterodisulfide reductase-related iron-sulfur binding cluster [Armatimonadota bacterium]